MDRVRIPTEEEKQAAASRYIDAATTLYRELEAAQAALARLSQAHRRLLQEQQTHGYYEYPVKAKVWTEHLGYSINTARDRITPREGNFLWNFVRDVEATGWLAEHPKEA